MAQDLILITGATGHLGFRTLILLLQHGYRARIAHRRVEQVDRLKQPASIQPFLDSIQFVHVPDITASDAYDEAIIGVDGVLHIASPIPVGSNAGDTDWQKLFYNPAEKGTLNLLNAASKEPHVKRVIITSSVVVLEPKDHSNRAGPYDLRDLPDSATMAEVSNAGMAYLYSKVLSHVAATNFAATHRSFDLIRILPAYIQGANELYTSAEEMSNTKKIGSNEGIMNTALGNVLKTPRINAQVLLDDVAKAHVLALRPEIARHGDNLLICGNGGDSIPWAEFLPIIRRQFPEAVARSILDPRVEDEDSLTYFDVSASERALEFKFAGAEEMVKSVIGQYVALVESS